MMASGIQAIGGNEPKRLQDYPAVGVYARIESHQQTDRHPRENSQAKSYQHSLNTGPGVLRQGAATRVTMDCEIHKCPENGDRPREETRIDEDREDLPAGEKDEQDECIPAQADEGIGHSDLPRRSTWRERLRQACCRWRWRSG